MKVHLPRLGLGGFVDRPVRDFEQLAALQTAHQLIDDPQAADVILFTQCHTLPDWRLTAIRGHPFARQFSGKTVVYNERDRPWCTLPGVYVSMPARHFDVRWQRASAYARLPFDEKGSTADSREPDLLFSFVGAMTARCRRAVLSLRHDDAVVEEVSGFMFWDQQSRDFERQRERFADIMRRSRFVLCPRGHGTTTFRLYEAMAAGRVPVIISDDWVPPLGPDWSDFSVAWPEHRVRELPSFLETLAPHWRDMSAAARASFDTFFAAGTSFVRIVDLSASLLDELSRRAFRRSPFGDPAYVRFLAAETPLVGQLGRGVREFFSRLPR